MEAIDVPRRTDSDQQRRAFVPVYEEVMTRRHEEEVETTDPASRRLFRLHNSLNKDKWIDYL
ncbi:hypothetical protein J6590_098811 [Homalodisca vitripennis]|nr:hypothetical protein J6590_098811 [Homalodisca vitripennis]